VIVWLGHVAGDCKGVGCMIEGMPGCGLEGCIIWKTTR
jgi:hypothetical protein